jgi:molybdopterin converting factor subunit 1
MAGFIKVLAFAGAKDVIGESELELALDDVRAAGPPTAGQVMDAICARYPGLTAHRRVIRIAVNGAYAEASTVVAAGDEVALIPPVAGG